MSAGKLGVLEDFFEHQIWFLEVGDGKRVVGASIKVEPSGYLLVVKAKSAEGPQVAFVGSQTLDGLRTKIKAAVAGSTLKWRIDQFALDRLQTL